MKPLEFQQKAIEELTAKFKILWNTNQQSQLILKSPTGSGKTFMTTSFINQLDTEPDWQHDVAFVWITFSEELALQSRDKYRQYFSGNLNNQLLTTEDFKQGELFSKDILFINWQKLVSKKAGNRVLRRPEDERNYKENGYYFEDVIENTQNANRNLVLIIDESHKNVTDSANRDVISKINPKIILKVSATPFNDEKEENDFYALKGRGKADIVEVKREDVVTEGLTKQKIVCQTEEELSTHKGQDLDELMLQLAIERRNQVAVAWQKLGKNINPLVLIQLPNDDSELEKQGVATKETVVRNYLKKQGIPDNKIASWFDAKKENLDFITQDTCPVDFLLFKLAAGTGWDCPRAHILVMYREIKKPVFHTQTLGRIVRMPVVDTSLNKELLTTGYLYTNHKRNEVGIPEQDGKNRPKVFSNEITVKVKKELLTIHTKNELQDSFASLFETSEKTVSDETKKQLVEEIHQSVTNLILTVDFQTDEGKKDLENHKVISEAITQKTAETKEEIEKIIQTQLQGKISESICEQIKKTTKEIVEKVESVSKNETETEFILDPCLKSDFLSRADYGDIGKVSLFQKHFIESMNEYFGIDNNAIMQDNSKLLEAKGISLSKELTQEVMANAVYHSENTTTDDELGKNIKIEVSANDVDKNFTWNCYEILGEQTEEEAKIANRARSWGPFKEALRQWFKKYAFSGNSLDEAYRIFLNDTFKNQSVFKQAITYSLKKYRPILNSFLSERIEKDVVSVPFSIKSHYPFSDEYEVFECEKSIVNPFYLRKEYKGRENETSFIKYLEESSELDWWFKNGDSGKEFLGIKYFDTTDQTTRLFYPDWIIKLADGGICILDTKGGNTASSQETKDKAEELHRRITVLNRTSKRKYCGGIVIFANGQWYINDCEEYKYSGSNLTNLGWKTLAWKSL